MASSWGEIVNILRKREIDLAIAESCTGGFISSCITDVPGSSDVFMGGFVTYSNEMKMTILGVSEETLKDHGAVSEECAMEMVEGLERRLESGLSLSVTGIAGPSGGTEEKPVGTVFIGTRRRGSATVVREYHLEGLSRLEFKEKVSSISMKLLLERL